MEIILFLGLIIVLVIVLILNKILKIRSQIILKLRVEKKSTYKKDIRQKLIEIDKANEQSEKNDKLFMERRKLKALKDTNFDLFYDEEKILHRQRLLLKKQSKWKGVIYYCSKKGNIYFISKEGKRIYRLKV